MRRLQVKTKDRRKVPVPDKLRDAMREAHELIEQSRKNPEINLNYDDAIQADGVIGGKCGTKQRPYVLTFYPERRNDRNVWKLTLHRTEVEDIGDGLMREIVLYCCTSSECQNKFREPNEHCFYCDYIVDPDLGTFPFPEATRVLFKHHVTGLDENSTREDFVKMLGEPDVIGGDIVHDSLGYIPPWIKYVRQDCQLRFEFNKEYTQIINVTVNEPEDELDDS